MFCVNQTQDLTWSMFLIESNWVSWAMIVLYTADCVASSMNRVPRGHDRIYHTRTQTRPTGMPGTRTSIRQCHNFTRM